MAPIVCIHLCNVIRQCLYMNSMSTIWLCIGQALFTSSNLNFLCCCCGVCIRHSMPLSHHMCSSVESRYLISNRTLSLLMHPLGVSSLANKSRQLNIHPMRLRALSRFEFIPVLWIFLRVWLCGRLYCGKLTWSEIFPWSPCWFQ